jgi:signal transduction histidine kinase
MNTDASVLAPRTILIVDDIAANIGILATRFEDEGWRVLVAQDGTEGLQRAHLVLPDVILLDVLMPGLDGLQTCRLLKENVLTRDIPVIFMTALTETVDKVRGFAAGAVDYVTKPFQMDEVMARVHTHLALRTAAKTLARTLADLQAARDELARSERLAGLLSLVSGLAHELNTPIGNCLTMASAQRERSGAMLEAVGGASGIKRSALEAYLDAAVQSDDLVVRNLRRLSGLIERFKQVAAGPRDDLQRKPFLLADLIHHSCLGQRQRCAAMGVEVLQDIPASLRLDSFPECLAQVLDIVIDNALTHGLGSAGDGVLALSASVQDDQQLRLRIHDNGVGIAPGHLERLFEPFFTTQMGGGAGLGLTAAHNLVTLTLGGRIAIDSGPQSGTTVTLTLPGLVGAFTNDP